MRIVAILAMWCAAACGQAISLPHFIGAKECAKCHAAEFNAQSKTGHAHALSAAPEHPLARTFVPDGIVRRAAYRFQFRWEGKELRVRAGDGKDVVDIPLEWAFGAGAQAVTFLTRVNPEWYLEHYFSYYPAAKTMAPTPGQQPLTASTLQLAMGLLYKSSDPETGAKGCFECHSTGPLSPDLRPTEAGVRCESCHGPGSLHRDDPKRALRNPGRMKASELNQFCGSCHRPPAADGGAIKWSEPWNVRHQPLYLDQSACFRKSSGALSCLTCHNPHEPLRSDAAFYNAKCASCHDSEERPPKAVCSTDCISCHMPRVSPQPYLRFTNHWIGVYRQADNLKPRPPTAPARP